MVTEVKQFYRYELSHYSTVDQFDDPIRSLPRLTLMEYGMTKETPKGYWVEAYYKGGLNVMRNYDTRWVSKTAKKRYAYPTKEEALNNYIKRSEIRVKHLDRQLDDTNHGLYLAKNELGSLNEISKNEKEE